MNGDETRAAVADRANSLWRISLYYIILYLRFRFEVGTHRGLWYYILLLYCYIADLGPRVLAVTDAVLKSK